MQLAQSGNDWRGDPTHRAHAAASLLQLPDKKPGMACARTRLADAAATVIPSAMERTRPPLISLFDTEQLRRVMPNDAWQSNTSVARQFTLNGVPTFQGSYDAVVNLRSQHESRWTRMTDHRDSPCTLLDIKIGEVVNTLADAVSQQRPSVAPVTAHGATLTLASARIQNIASTLNLIDRPTG
jgi:hypothetical protein